MWIYILNTSSIWASNGLKGCNQILCFYYPPIWAFHGLLLVYKANETTNPTLVGRGLKAIVYLDDGIVAVKGEQAAIQESAQVKLDLERAGFVINLDKSKWEPCHTMEWLGFQINLAKGELSVPANKISMLKSQLLEVKGAQLLQARKLASLIGKIVSMSIDLGPVTRLMTRAQLPD